MVDSLLDYHFQVYRSVTKLLLLVPHRPFQSCSFKTEVLEDVPVRVYSPSTIESDVAIVYFHGGNILFHQ